MTIKIPDPNLADKILKFYGKKRGVIFPDQAYTKFGPHIYAVAKRESFWKALLRPRNQDLPAGMIDIFSFQDLIDKA